MPAVGDSERNTRCKILGLCELVPVQVNIERCKRKASVMISRQNDKLADHFYDIDVELNTVLPEIDTSKRSS